MAQVDKSQEGLTSFGGGTKVPVIFHIDCGNTNDAFSVLALDYKDGATTTTVYLWWDHTDGKLVYSTTQPTAHDSSHSDV